MASPTIYKTTSSSPSLSNPAGIAIDPDRERLLICDRGNNRLVWCYLDGIKQISTKSTYGSGGQHSFSAPRGVTYCKGYFYVCDSGNHTVVRLRARDLRYKDHFGTVGTSGSTNALLNTPSDVVCDKQFVYVADSANDRIMKLNVSNLGYNSKSTLVLDNPQGIDYKRLAGEALFISSTDDNLVIKTTKTFTSIESVSTVTSPKGLVHHNDMVSVLQNKTSDDALFILASDGLATQTTHADSTTTLSSPYGIATHRDMVFISDSGNNRITVWRAYNPRDSLTQSSPAKFGGVFFDNPVIIVDEDSVIVGATQESGSPNRWKEENTNNYSVGWVEES